jgi:hypothetical protein
VNEVYSEKMTLKYVDETTGEIKEIPVKDLDERLKDLLEILKKCIEKLQRVGDYGLQSFEVSLSLKAGMFIITAEGSIKLKYER